MNLTAIKRYAKEFLDEAYGMELVIPIELNGRLTRTLGRFHFNKRGSNRVPVKLDFAKKLLEFGTIEDIKGVIRHELIHYAMFVAGRPFHDGEEEFEAELVKYNAPATNVLRIKSPKLVITHECGCGNQWKQRRKMSSGYLCSSCKTEIKEVSRDYVVL